MFSLFGLGIYVGSSAAIVAGYVIVAHFNVWLGAISSIVDIIW